eukprot:g2123.t1
MYSWIMFNSDLFQNSPNPGVVKAGSVDSELHLGGDEDLSPPSSTSPNSMVERNPGVVDAGSVDSELHLGGDEELGPPGSGTSTNSMAERKKESKREKQRIVARNFRKRKKERMAQLQREVEHLRSENKNLHIRLAENSTVKKACDPSTSALRESHIIELQGIVEKKTMSTKSIKRIKHIVKEHVDFFADSGRIRRAGLRYHVRELKKLMLPTSVTKLCVWGLQQEDEFFKDAPSSSGPSAADRPDESGDSLWGIICGKLELTEEQRRGIMKNRARVGEQRSNISQTINLVSKLETKISDTLSMNENLLQSIMSELSPVQQAKYLIWQENNEACMQMLDHLWRVMPVGNSKDQAEE